MFRRGPFERLRSLLATSSGRAVAVGATAIFGFAGSPIFAASPITNRAVDASPPLCAPHSICKLTSDRDLKDLTTHKAVVLVCRGHSSRDQLAAKLHLKEALQNLHRETAGIVAYVIDDDSNKSLADTLLTRLGIYHDKPFLFILDDFLHTERKFVSTQNAIPSAREMSHMITDFLAGKLKPTMLGQARPPGDRSPHCKELFEVVTDSFDELVLDPRVDVLIEGYTPKCDACKAFAPRMRMLARLCQRRFGDRVRIAAMNILDNDRPVEHMPEKWTPSLRLFVARDSVDALPATAKRSVLYRYGKDGQSDTASPTEPPDALSAPGASPAPSALSGAEPSSGAEEKVRVVIPSVLDLLRFLELNCGGRFVVSDDIAREAELLEQEAVILERAYDQVLEYMEVWQAYTEAITQPPLGHDAAPHEKHPTRTETATAKELQRRIMTAYKFLLAEAAEGSATDSLAKLQAIADWVEQKGVGKRIEAAWGPGAV